MARLVVSEWEAGPPWPAGEQHLVTERALGVGRECEVPVGRAPQDLRLSRQALLVSCTPSGWHVEQSNRNGAVTHPWARPAYRTPAQETIRWPLVAIKLIGSPGGNHWVLLSEPAFVPAVDAVSGAMTGTAIGLRTQRSDEELPRPLTAPQLAAVRGLFGEYLQWPPRESARVRQLKQVASKLSLEGPPVTVSAIQERLRQVRDKAIRLGMARDMPLTDPEYVYTLAGHGYLTPSAADLSR